MGPTPSPRGRRQLPFKPRWREYAYALAVTGVSTRVAWLMFPHLGLVDLVMVYLLGVVAVAARRRIAAPSIFASVLSVLGFDFCFVQPRSSLSVADAEYLVTFGVMLLVALVISDLTTPHAASRRRPARCANAGPRPCTP